MTQEDKELLLKDLCARLPYGVICYNSDTESNFKLCDVADIDSGYPTFDYGYGELKTVKPYLRPMSSMTEEEINMMWDISENNAEAEGSSKITDLLNKWNLDHHHLIEKGLAIEVTEENNPYKE